MRCELARRLSRCADDESRGNIRAHGVGQGDVERVAAARNCETFACKEFEFAQRAFMRQLNFHWFPSQKEREHCDGCEDCYDDAHNERSLGEPRWTDVHRACNVAERRGICFFTDE